MKDTVRTNRITLSMGTETSEGFIRHKLMTVNGVTFEAPVALQVFEESTDGPLPLRNLITVKRQDVLYPVPKRTNGHLCYALPGGNVYVEGT